MVENRYDSSNSQKCYYGASSYTYYTSFCNQ